jgi:hypothetical protein
LEATVEAPGGRSGGIEHKNFFVAKTCDSESAQARFSRVLLFSKAARRICAHQTSMKESAAAQAFLAFSANARRKNSLPSRIALRTSREVASRNCAARAGLFPSTLP